MVHPWHLLDGYHFLVWVIGAKLLHLQDIIRPLEFFRIDKKQRLLDTVLVSVIAHWEHPRIEGNATPAKNNIWILSQVESFVRTFSACFGLQQTWGNWWYWTGKRVNESLCSDNVFYSGGRGLFHYCICWSPLPGAAGHRSFCKVPQCHGKIQYSYCVPLHPQSWRKHELKKMRHAKHFFFKS